MNMRKQSKKKEKKEMEIRKRKQKESRGRWEIWWGEFLISLEIQKKRKTF